MLPLDWGYRVANTSALLFLKPGRSLNIKVVSWVRPALCCAPQVSCQLESANAGGNGSPASLLQLQLNCVGCDLPEGLARFHNLGASQLYALVF